MGDDLARTCGHQRQLQEASQAETKISQTVANKPLLSFEDSNNNQKSELIKTTKESQADSNNQGIPGNKDSTHPEDANAAGPELGVQKIDSDLAEVFGGKDGMGVSSHVDKSQPSGIQSSDKLGLQQQNQPPAQNYCPRASVLMR